MTILNIKNCINQDLSVDVGIDAEAIILNLVPRWHCGIGKSLNGQLMLKRLWNQVGRVENMVKGCFPDNHIG